MATRKNTLPTHPDRLKPDVGNPFQHVAFEARDLRGIEPAGGPPKIFEPVDDAYRKSLAETLDAAQQQLAGELRDYPHSLAPLILRLREKGIAKSHRPLKLVEEAGLVPAGHERVEEMMVGAHAGSITALRSIILEREIQAIKANLSVVRRIDPWSRQHRNPEGTLALRQQGQALLHFFRYAHESANTHLFETVRSLLKRLGFRHGFHRQGPRGGFFVSLSSLNHVDEEKFNLLLGFPGVRRLMPEPMYRPCATAAAGAPAAGLALVRPSEGLPTVAVFDTGVAATAADLRPWIVGTHTFVLPPDTDHEHGTNVASLVAGAHVLNNGHEDLPAVGSLVYDVCGLESAGGGYVSDLITRVTDAIAHRPDVRVWNLSLGAAHGCEDQSFSDFAQALDQLSDQHGVLFVVAAGNYLDEPRRSWPVIGDLKDRVSSPGESVRALTVGSICHLSAPGTLNAAGEPAAYSRRGPGPVFTPKPDIVHAGGGVHAPWNAGASSVAVLSASNDPLHGFGTSYAAPMAASMAAHAWQAIDRQQGLAATPALVKAMLIHAAQLSSPQYTPRDRRYYGAGLPRNVIAGLFDRPDSFTLVFDARLPQSMRWRKDHYPIPEGLLRDGKFCGEVIITAVYAPPVDPNSGAEYVRANVELSFGTVDENGISSKVPLKGEDVTDGYEALQVEHGGKWAPVKVHRKRFPNGVAGDHWALQARMFLRAFEPAMAEGLRVHILCTLRALDGNPEIHAQGLRALVATNWVHQNLPVRVPVHTAA